MSLVNAFLSLFDFLESFLLPTVSIQHGNPPLVRDCVVSAEGNNWPNGCTVEKWKKKKEKNPAPIKTQKTKSQPEEWTNLWCHSNVERRAESSPRKSAKEERHVPRGTRPRTQISLPLPVATCPEEDISPPPPECCPLFTRDRAVRILPLPGPEKTLRQGGAGTVVGFGGEQQPRVSASLRQSGNGKAKAPSGTKQQLRCHNAVSSGGPRRIYQTTPLPCSESRLHLISLLLDAAESISRQAGAFLLVTISNDAALGRCACTISTPRRVVLCGCACSFFLSAAARYARFPTNQTPVLSLFLSSCSNKRTTACIVWWRPFPYISWTCFSLPGYGNYFVARGTLFLLLRVDLMSRICIWEGVCSIGYSYQTVTPRRHLIWSGRTENSVEVEESQGEEVGSAFPRVRDGLDLVFCFRFCFRCLVSVNLLLDGLVRWQP